MPQLAQLHRMDDRPAQRAPAAGMGRPGPDGLTQLVADMNAGPRGRALNGLAQRMQEPLQRMAQAPVQRMTQEPVQCMAQEPTQRHAPSQLKALRSGLLSSTAPVQRFGFSDLFSWRTAKAAALGLGVGALASTGVGLPLAAAIGLGAVSGAATYAAGPVAGLGAAALGTAGVLTAGALPALATTLAFAPQIAGGLAGGVAGLGHSPMAGVLGAATGAAMPAVGLGALGSAFGATIGADIQSTVQPPPKLRVRGQDAPTVGEAILTRAREKAARTTGRAPATMTWAEMQAEIEDPALRAFLNGKEHLGPTMDALINTHYGAFGTDRSASVRDQNAVSAPHIALLRNALVNNAFVDGILRDTPLRAPHAGAPTAPALNFGPHDNPPSEARDARRTFNTLVNRPALPPVTPVERGYTDPVSFMSNTGGLTVGFGSTPGVAVHEMGHHLENNLSPVEFGSLHNFLLARSRTRDLRSTGTEHLINQPHTSGGYDTTTVNPDVGGHQSMTRLAVSQIGNNLGIGAATRDIDRFTQTTSNAPESSYATKIYPGAHHTEFLATSMHYMANSDQARALIRDDPLRAALWLSFANPTAYGQVRDTLAIHGANLDLMINRLH